jgi:hypothetical protein
MTARRRAPKPGKTKQRERSEEMLTGSSTTFYPWLWLLAPVLTPLLVSFLWLLFACVVGTRFRDDGPRRLKLAIALTIVAAILPAASVVLAWTPRAGLLPLLQVGWVRDWSLVIFIGGMSVMLAALTFGFVYALPQARAARPGSVEDERFNGLRELCLAAVFGGAMLGSVPTIMNDVQFGAKAVSPALSLSAAAIWVLLFGFWLGRASLHLRRRVDDGASPRGEAWKS